MLAHARGLVASGKPVTQRAIMLMLDCERPGHRTLPTEISRALRSVDRSKRPRQGQRVEVDGREFASVREAARAEGVSPEAARKRLASRFPGWRPLD